MRRVSARNHEDKARGTFRAGATFGVMSFAATAFVGLLTGVITARMYGIRVVGDYALAYAPTGVVWLLSTVREQPALLRALTRLKPRDPLVTGLSLTVATFSTALTAVVSALAAVGAYFAYNGPLHRPDLFLPAVASLVLSLSFVNSAWNLDTVFNSFRAGRQLFWIRLHQVVSFLVLSIVMWYVTPSVWGIIIAWNASWASALLHRIVAVRIWMRWRVPRDAIRAGWEQLPEILRFGLKITPGFLTQGISDQAGVWILGDYTSVAAVGAFSRSWALATRLVELNFRVTEMLLPTLVERRATADNAGFDHALVDSLRYVTVLLLLPAAVGGGAAQGIMAVYGAGFSQGATTFAILMAMPAVVTASSIEAHALFACNRTRPTVISGFVRMLLTVIGGVILVRMYGLNGMAIAMLAGAVAQLVAQTRAVSAITHDHMWRLVTARQLIGTASGYLAGFGVSHVAWQELGGAAGVIVGLGAGSMAYGVTIAAVGGLLDRDRLRLHHARSALIKRTSMRFG